MDFQLTREEEMFRDQVRRFAQKELPPLVPIMENNSEFKDSEGYKAFQEIFKNLRNWLQSTGGN